jgi:hypothetical protein
VADRGDRLFVSPDAPHRVHDLLLIAAFAAGDSTGDDRERAGALVAGCEECASLAADLGVIRLATAAVPAPARTRDFRLTSVDADRLRPHGIGRLFAAVAGPRLQRAHPVAAGLTMLGLTGLLVSSISLGGVAPSAGSAAGLAPSDRTELFMVPAASPPTDMQAGGELAEQVPADHDQARDQAEQSPAAPAASTETPRVPIAVGSAILAIAGITLFFAARIRRRRFG